MLNPTPQPDSVSDSSLPDRDLLRRFVQDADESAFTEIVRRHQGLVLGVCRRVLHNSADVDDAFQATFIALARRPRHVRSATSLSSWLYTVAWRTSWRVVKQRRTNPVESLTSNPAEEHPGPLDQIATAQECVVLDEELNHLPAKYRDVLVMTYFASQTSQQIADQLNVSKGTIDGRVRQARNMLRVRLARRGVAIGAIAVAAGMSTGPTAVASPALFDATIQLGAQTLSGSVPGTTDLSVLEPFIKPELTMLNSKLVLSALLATTAVAGIAGMNGLASSDDVSPPAALVSQIEVEAAADDSDADTSTLAISVSSANDKAPEAVEEELVLNGVGSEVSSTVWSLRDVGTARFKPYSDDAPAVERWMHEMLDTPVPLLEFSGEVPLSEVLDQLQSYVTNTYGSSEGETFRLDMYPDWSELNQEGVVDLEDITVQNIQLEGVSLRNALALIFEQTIDPELTYEIENEVMKITTKAKAEATQYMTFRVYDVAGIQPLTEELAEIVTKMTSNVLGWQVDGGDGEISMAGNRLVVLQSAKGHRMIADLLNQLSDSSVSE